LKTWMMQLLTGLKPCFILGLNSIPCVADGLKGFIISCPLQSEGYTWAGSFSASGVRWKCQVALHRSQTICIVWAMISKELPDGHFSMAALLGVGYHCFLRTGELLAVRPCDFLRGMWKGIVRLPTSKGHSRHKLQESVTIEEPISV
jgi:hypothetical protein